MAGTPRLLEALSEAGFGERGAGGDRLGQLAPGARRLVALSRADCATALSAGARRRGGGSSSMRLDHVLVPAVGAQQAVALAR